MTKLNQAIVVLTVGLLASQATADDLVSEGAKVEKLAGGFRFTEGPVAGKDGVYFSDIPNNRIHRWSYDGKLTTFRENSGGANGLFFDKAGRLIACEGKARQVTATTKDGKVTVPHEDFNSIINVTPLVNPNGLVFISLDLSDII